MALQYLSSSNVHMFPSSMRSEENDVYSRFTTELNLVNMVNRVSTGTFVSGSWTDGGNTWVDFTILGYHFDANIQPIVSNSSFSVGQSLYAIAIVGYDPGGNETKYDSRLRGYNGALQTIIDQGGNFLGVTFTTSLEDFNTIQQNLADTYVADVLELGTKESNSTFSVNESTSSTNIEVITEEEIQDMWES